MVMNKDDEHFLTCVAETRGETGGRLRIEKFGFRNTESEMRWTSQADQMGKRKREREQGFVSSVSRWT